MIFFELKLSILQKFNIFTVDFQTLQEASALFLVQLLNLYAFVCLKVFCISNANKCKE